jgi:hypothetical protein
VYRGSTAEGVAASAGAVFRVPLGEGVGQADRARRAWRSALREVEFGEATGGGEL